MTPILVVQGNVSLRKTMRSFLERAGFSVMAVGSIGEAAARLRSLEYALVVCNDRQRSTKWSEDYELLIDARYPPVRADATHELHLPRVELMTFGILLIPSAEPAAVRDAISGALVILRSEATKNLQATPRIADPSLRSG